MSVFSSLVQVAGQNLRTRGRGVSAGWAMGIVAAIVAVPGIGVGVGVAHAQACDPVETAKLIAADGEMDDSFSNTVSISGNTAVIGASSDGDNGPRSGSVYIFTRTGGVWTQQAKILPDDGAEGERFGSSVSIDGDTAIIGATWWVADDIRPGSVYVFTRTGGVWTQQAKLLPDDGAVDGAFGGSVSLNGDTVVIGAGYDDENGTDYGAAYVFTRTGGVWTQQAKILPDDGTEDSRGRFGQSVAVSGDTIVIGSRMGNSITMFGSAFVFTRNQGVWTQQVKLQASDRGALDNFGGSVAIDGDTALIGAPSNNSGGLLGAGSAYVFTRTGGIWTEQAQLLADDRAAGDRFGWALSIEGNTAVIGAPYDDDNGNWSGSAYLFSRAGGVWTQQAKILPADGATNDSFGNIGTISVSNDTAVIGTAGFSDSLNSGAAYVFDLGCTSCPPDLNNDGVVNTQDFIVFLGAWSAGDPLADWNNDGVVNTQDFIAFLADWAAGCP